MLPKISVIIGVLNMDTWLEKTITSIINQQYPATELIIMDGGSTDGTLDIIKKYASHISHWQSKKDKGHPDACNQALDIATGDFILFVNADDFIDPELFNKMLKKYQENPATNMITCGIRIIKQNGQDTYDVIDEMTQPAFLQTTVKNMLFEHTAFNARFYRKDLFTRFGKFIGNDATGHIIRSNDREFLLRLALAGIRSDIIPEPLYTYLSHQSASSFSKKNMERAHSEHLLLAEKLLNDPSISAENKLLVKQWQAQQLVYLFLTYVRQGDVFKALRTAYKGIITHPVDWVKVLAVYSCKKITRRIMTI